MVPFFFSEPRFNSDLGLLQGASRRGHAKLFGEEKYSPKVTRCFFENLPDNYKISTRCAFRIQL